MGNPAQKPACWCSDTIQYLGRHCQLDASRLTLRSSVSMMRAGRIESHSIDSAARLTYAAPNVLPEARFSRRRSSLGMNSNPRSHQVKALGYFVGRLRANQLTNTIELFWVLETDRNLAAAGRILPDVGFRAQRQSQLLLKCSDLC